MSQNRNQPPQQGMQRRPQAAVVRLPMMETGKVTTNSAQEASQWIEAAYEAGGQVVSPFNHVPDLAPGFGIAYSEVSIKDFDPYGADLYTITGAGGRFGLHKAPLDAIGRGYGIDWPTHWTFLERFNDERDSDPRCCKVTVAGRYRDADGTWKTLPPLTKEIDLREGAPEVEKIRADQEYKETKDLPPNATPEAREARLKTARRKADAEINQLRKFIRAHAQTKARLQVIRTLVRSSYSLAELQAGPFRCFRVIKNYKAPVDRPDLQARMDDLAIERLSDASDALYGASVSTRELPPADDKPYTTDAELVEYEKAVAAAEAGDPAGENGTGQGDGSEATATTVQGEQTQSQAVQHCTAESGCLGPDSKHVMACYGKTEPEQTQEVEPTESTADERPWVLTEGPARNLAVNDPKVTTATLIQMEHELAAAMKPKGLVYDQLNDEKKDRLSYELRKIGEELNRRKVTEGRLKKGS
jgi:hypothetical protein